MSDYNYCPGCGTALNDAATAPEAAEVETTAEVVSAEVEIARIQADRDVTLAKIGARVEESSNDTEQVAELAAAEAKADALESVITPPETETPDAPVVVVDAPETVTDTDTAEPPPDKSESDTGSPDKPSKPSYGSPSWF